MKVCTDSCIFGAYVKLGQETKKILDIGTGSGLLSLMLAQRVTQVEIDAVELDSAAAAQARTNFTNSPWGNRIHIFNQAIQKFTVTEKYDLIISNPPFFNKHLESPDKKINTAHHTTSLSTDELLTAVHKFIKPEGELWILLPPFESDLFNKKAEGMGLYVNEKLTIRDKKNSMAIRTISLLSYKSGNCVEKELVIKDETGNYTIEFTELLQEYYLHL
jgi:tRNA1Val (adenine37-N6)-methyltransferase